MSPHQRGVESYNSTLLELGSLPKLQTTSNYFVTYIIVSVEFVQVVLGIEVSGMKK